MTNKRSAYIMCEDKRQKTTFSVYGERVVFKSNSSMSQTPNTMTIQVYGVGDDDMGRVLEKGYTVRLYAGIEGYEGLIGEGQVITARELLTPTGVALDITALDGDDFYAVAVNRSISAGISLRDLAIELIGLTGGTIGIGQISPSAGGVRLPRGMSVIGSPIQMLRNVAKQVNAAFYINQGLVYIVKFDEMVGQPFSLVEDDVLSEASRDGYILNLAYAINPAIKIGTVIKLPESGGTVSTAYKVQRIYTEGDTKGTAWKMVIEGAELTGEGSSQSAVTENVWR